jgi:hypothetical protein
MRQYLALAHSFYFYFALGNHFSLLYRIQFSFYTVVLLSSFYFALSIDPRFIFSSSNDTGKYFPYIFQYIGTPVRLSLLLHFILLVQR